MSKLDAAWHNPDTGDIHSPKGRLVYPTLPPGEARGIQGDDNSDPKFSVTLLIPKAANIDVLKKALAEAAASKFGAEWSKKKLKFPLHKTEDSEKLSHLKDAYPIFIRASAYPDAPPFVFGPNAQLFKGDLSDIYSGRHGVVTFVAKGFDTAGNKGVRLALKRVQLLDHDEAIAGGRVATASGFESVEVSSGTGGGTAQTADDVFGDTKLDDEIPFR